MNGEGAPGGGLAEKTPVQSPEQGTRAPDILQGVDKELEVARAMTPSISRVLVASATENPERFDPDNVNPLDTTPNTNERSKLSALSPDNLAYAAAEKVSVESRSKTTESYADWKRGLEAWVDDQKLKNIEGEDVRRLEVLKIVGVIDEGGDTNVDGFYNKYLNNQSNIHEFIKDLSVRSTNDEGIVDIQGLKTDLNSILPFLKVFGDVHNVDLLVRDFAIARALLTQSDNARKYVVTNAADHITHAVPADHGESVYLKALARHARTISTSPIVPPVGSSPARPNTSAEAGYPQPNTEMEDKAGDYAAAKTVKHEKEAAPNKPHEDRCVFVPERGMFAVLDGLGAHGNGDKAAQLGRDFLIDAARFIPTDLSLEETQDRLLRLAIETNQYVHEEAMKIQSDMGATLSLGYMWESPQGEKKFITVNIGDSRIYRLRNGNLELLSDDDNGLTPVEHETLDNVDTTADFNALPQKLKNAWTTRNQVGSALNNSYPKAILKTVDVEENDTFLITSDGIHDNLTRKRIAEILRDNSDPDAAVRVLIEESRRKAKLDSTQTVRAKPDDMTAIVFKATLSIPQKVPADTLQPGDTGVYAQRADIIRQHDQLFDSIGRPLTSEEMYYLISGNEPAKMDRFFQLLPDVRLARKQRDGSYQRIKDLHDRLQETMQRYVANKFRGLTDPTAIMEANIKIIEDASVTFTDLDDLLLVLKGYRGIKDEQISDLRTTFSGLAQQTQLQQGERIQYILYFGKDNTGLNGVTQTIPGIRRIPANYDSLPADKRLKSLVDTLYRPTIK